jgi:hypothetical protein
MWTEREKYIECFNEIQDYLETMDNFHDYRIGHLHYAERKATITVEEYIPNSHISKTAGLIWDFEFKNVEEFKIDNDCVLQGWITEINLENKEFVFGCTNGYIVIKAEQVKLGVPTPKA